MIDWPDAVGVPVPTDATVSEFLSDETYNCPFSIATWRRFVSEVFNAVEVVAPSVVCATPDAAPATQKSVPLLVTALRTLLPAAKDASVVEVSTAAEASRRATVTAFVDETFAVPVGES